MKKGMYAVSVIMAILMLSVASCSKLGLKSDMTTPLAVPVTYVTTGTTPAENVTEPVQVFTEPEISEQVVSETVQTQPEVFDGKFKQGTWFSYNNDECKYYFFNDDKKSGTRLSVKRGTAAAFLYETSDSTENTSKPAVFNIDTTDNITNAQITISDPDHISVTWDDKSEERLTYLSDQGIDNFMFYTDEELSSMGLRYYLNISGAKAKDIFAESKTNEDMSVTTKIYKTVNADQQVVLAWYITDRFTASGEISDDGLVGNGTAVDLK